MLKLKTKFKNTAQAEAKKGKSFCIKFKNWTYNRYWTSRESSAML